MRVKASVGRCVLVSVVIVLGFAPILFGQTKYLLEHPQFWNVSQHWISFHYHWVSPGFSIPVHEWQTPTEYFWPSLTLEEASAWTGQCVRCAYRTNTLTGGCKVGERGKVKNIESVPDGGYFVVVHWETRSEDDLAYYGRYSSRLFLTPE
jgi:hypothetical protein